MADEILCRECKNPLPAGARKCTKCSSFQDMRRIVFVWSGLFTAILALVPLWSAAISLWTLAFPEPADVRLAVASCRPERLITYLTNTGGRPAMLGSPRVEFLEGSTWNRFNMEFAMDEDDLVSETEEIDIVTLAPPNEASFASQEDGGCRLRAVFPVAGEEGERTSVMAECTCEI